MSRASALTTACEATVLIESSRTVSAEFCACMEGAQSWADTDLRIPLAHKQVRVKEADLYHLSIPCEKGCV